LAENLSAFGEIEAKQEIMLDLEGDKLVFRNEAKEKQNT